MVWLQLRVGPFILQAEGLKMTVSIDFAGTRQEASEFVAANADKFPHGLTQGRGGRETTPNGDCTLYAKYKNGSELVKVQQAFVGLGWPVEAQS